MPNEVLVTGASGLLAVAAVEAFLSSGWDVVGTSRRKPELPSGRDIEFVPVDLRDEAAARAAFEKPTDMIPIPARERDPRDNHDNFFFDQEDYVREMGAKHGFNYAALRPQLVTGPTPGVLNVLPAIDAYAAIRREKGEPFSFPGGPSFAWEAADAGLVGDVMAWAAQASQAANEAFNIGVNVRAGRAAFGRCLAPGGSPAVGVTA